MLNADIELDHTTNIIEFLDFIRQPVLKHTQTNPNNLIAVNPNGFLATIFGGNYDRRWLAYHSILRCSDFMRTPSRHITQNLFFNGTEQLLSLACELSTFHNTKGIVGDSYWFTPTRQHVLIGATMHLQCESVIDFIESVFAPNESYVKWPTTVPGMYFFFVFLSWWPPLTASLSFARFAPSNAKPLRSWHPLWPFFV